MHSYVVLRKDARCSLELWVSSQFSICSKTITVSEANWRFKHMSSLLDHWNYNKACTVIAYNPLLFSSQNEVVRIFLAGNALHQSIPVHLCWYVMLVRQKKFQRITPEHLIPFCKSPCGALLSNSTSPPSPCSTLWWEITFCLDSRLFFLKVCQSPWLALQ